MSLLVSVSTLAEKYCGCPHSKQHQLSGLPTYCNFFKNSFQIVRRMRTKLGIIIRGSI